MTVSTRGGSGGFPVEFEAPRLSVVVASHNGWKYLRGCLDSLSRQCDCDDVEVVVVVHRGTDQADRVAAEAPRVRVLQGGPLVSVPELRIMGIRAARGRFVALLEDHCTVDDQWVPILIALHESGHHVVGGTVENATKESLFDWSVYLWEYHPFMNPLLEGPAQRLPGNNVSFDRFALARLEEEFDRASWELAWFDRLRAEGIELRASPRLVVHHQRRFRPWRFWRFTVLHGRNYAATRPLPRLGERALRLLTTPLLPMVVVFRIACNVLRKRRLRLIGLACVPYFLGYAVGFSLGEAIGYLRRRQVPDPGWGTG